MQPLRGELAGVVFFEGDDARIAAQWIRENPVRHVDRVDPRRPAFQQNLREPAVGRAQIQADPVVHLQCGYVNIRFGKIRKIRKSAEQFVRAATRILAARQYFEARVGSHRNSPARFADPVDQDAPGQNESRGVFVSAFD